jgi:hypothetical protein
LALIPAIAQTAPPTPYMERYMPQKPPTKAEARVIYRQFLDQEYERTAPKLTDPALRSLYKSKLDALHVLMFASPMRLQGALVASLAHLRQLYEGDFPAGERDRRRELGNRVAG